jgi:hypothetical protein
MMSAMSQGFGMEKPGAHSTAVHRAPARYLVLIDTAGTIVARLCLESREEVAEFDAGTEEVALMTKGLQPVKGANGPEWDRALAGHSDAERTDADVFTLDV